MMRVSHRVQVLASAAPMFTSPFHWDAHRAQLPVSLAPYRGTSSIRNCRPLRPYSRTMPRVLWGS